MSGIRKLTGRAICGNRTCGLSLILRPEVNSGTPARRWTYVQIGTSRDANSVRHRRFLGTAFRERCLFNGALNLASYWMPAEIANSR